MVHLLAYSKILQSDLVVAMGCTEPIAIALCAAKAREILGECPESIDAYCSGNIIKNVHSVTVPNSKGLKGVEIAAALGAFGGNASKGLEVLTGLSDEEIALASDFANQGNVTVHHENTREKLFIRCVLKSIQNTAEVVISGRHTNITVMKKNEIRLNSSSEGMENAPDADNNLSQLNIDDIYAFASFVDLDNDCDLMDTLDRQIAYNVNIASVGIAEPWGNEIGRTLLNFNKDGSDFEATAWAAAGSDARMGGCAMPVVTNSGSGNQGITVSVPVIMTAMQHGYSREKLYRALIISNLVNIHEKAHIGNLSAFCGAVTAAAGAGAGIAYLYDMSLEQIKMVITNTLAGSLGILCDGAKPSCALKIYAALSTAMLAIEMAKNSLVIEPGEGFVGPSIEMTIDNIGQIAVDGMDNADAEMLKVIINNNNSRTG